MEYSCVQLNDLPDEILMIIFGNLDNHSVLYSLIGVNKRLNKIVHDSIFTGSLTLMRCASNNFVYPLPDPMLDRFCSHILPEIHQKIKWLDLESLSMKRILLATNYPNLTRLGLFNIEEQIAIHLFTDEALFTCTFKNQILSLVIDTNTNRERKSTKDVKTLIFAHIFTMFTNLRYFNFDPSSIWYQTLSFGIPPPIVISSTLLELHVGLENFTDCLYLLDGRFNQLEILYVKISEIHPQHSTIKKEILPNLKCFSLYCHWITVSYDELIIPLLHRMSNLAQLDLSLIVWNERGFIDGNDLKENIINFMPLLNKFKFNIYSLNRFYNQNNFPSNEYIHHTFKDFKENQIISFVDYFPSKRESQCHIYSYPYNLNFYKKLTNNFPGGIFACVREVELYDERPFEHEFFLQIEKSFPLMEKLTLVNRKRQNNKRFRRSNNKNQDLSIIKYPHLIELDLIQTHKDYHEQFLVDTKMCLPDDVNVYMDYQQAKKVTRNFKRKTTRSNCAKMSCVHFYSISTYPDHLKDYFRHVVIF